MKTFPKFLLEKSLNQERFSPEISEIRKNSHEKTPLPIKQ